MSEGDYEMEWPSDEDVNADDQGSEGEIEVNNNYYEAEGMMKQDPAEAIARFKTVVLLEEPRPEQHHSFNATKFIILLCSQLG